MTPGSTREWGLVLAPMPEPERQPAALRFSVKVEQDFEGRALYWCTWSGGGEHTGFREQTMASYTIGDRQKLIEMRNLLTAVIEGWAAFRVTKTGGG